MKDALKVYYDEAADVLYLARAGEERAFVEIYPGVGLELNEHKEIIGIEILRASEILREVIEALRHKIVA